MPWLPVLALLLSAGLLPGAEIAVRIRAESLVGTPRPTLGEVADVEGDPAVCERLRALTVAELASLTPVQVDARLVTALATRAAAPATLRIAGSGTVARRRCTFGDAEQFAVAAATAPGARITPVRCSSALTVPEGSVLTAEPLDPQAIGEVSFCVRAMDAGREAGRSLVVLRIERDVDVVVAVRAIARGEVIAPNDLRCERRLATRANLAAAVDPASLAGCVARRDLTAGEPVLPALVAIRPAVRAGATVTALLPGKGFSVELQGTAVADARAGERVGVRRSGDNALLNCIAQADGTVLVQP